MYCGKFCSALRKGKNSSEGKAVSDKVGLNYVLKWVSLLAHLASMLTRNQILLNGKLSYQLVAMHSRERV